MGQARQITVNSLFTRSLQTEAGQSPARVTGEKKPALGGLQYSDSRTIPFQHPGLMTDLREESLAPPSCNLGYFIKVCPP